MWSLQKTHAIQCTVCGTHLAAHAEACPECTYPVMTKMQDPLSEQESSLAAVKECRLLQILGIGVASGGLIAAIADSPLAAGISITIGLATYLTGLLGIWWNRDD